ncbi:MAG: fimbrillin family protein [Muribaculaceae bacterium]|nr:fimbrillin family protein [Muribaculaceae bacterium]
MTSKNFRLMAALPLVAMAALAVSCGDDAGEMHGNSAAVDDGAIRFAAAAELSRAGDITTNNLTSFNVYAYTGTASAPVTFMDNVVVTKTASNNWTYSPLQYWPAKQSVDFYAFAPSTWVGADGPLTPVPYDAASGTEDIVYAVSPDLTGNSGMANAQVVFNFRHALSKLTVKMSSTNPELKVVVTNVAMTNIMTRGNFSFPAGSTADAASAETVGKWTDQNTPNAYVLQWAQSPTDQLTLTSTPTVIAASGLGRGGEMYVLPQQLTYRSQGSGSDTYIGVQCSIYDAKSGERLWPNENTPEEDLVPGSSTGDGMLKFPLSTSRYSEWQPGVHYIYSLVINSNEEMGAIEFGTPTVDTFIDIEQTYE